jgi:hypothetical protein
LRVVARQRSADAARRAGDQNAGHGAGYAAGRGKIKVGTGSPPAKAVSNGPDLSAGADFGQ